MYVHIHIIVIVTKLKLKTNKQNKNKNKIMFTFEYFSKIFVDNMTLLENGFFTIHYFFLTSIVSHSPPSLLSANIFPCVFSCKFVSII